MDGRVENGKGMGVNRRRGEEGERMDGFSEVLNSNSQYALQCQFASPCQISYKSVKPFRIYGRLLIFQDGGHSPSWFLKFEILTTHALRKSKMHYHAKFCANWSRHYGDMVVFHFLRWRPSAIFDCQNLKISTALYPSEGRNVSSCQI